MTGRCHAVTSASEGNRNGILKPYVIQYFTVGEEWRSKHRSSAEDISSRKTLYFMPTHLYIGVLYCCISLSVFEVFWAELWIQWSQELSSYTECRCIFWYHNHADVWMLKCRGTCINSIWEHSELFKKKKNNSEISAAILHLC